MTLPKWVYRFSEGAIGLKHLLGGKGAGLAEMTNLGLPVPPGFTITTQACNAYLKTGNFPPHMWSQVFDALRELEWILHNQYGRGQMPLLVSVRSGAPVSMPGMMDTILNLGLNDETVEDLSRATHPGFAYDSYRRLIQMYGATVLGIAGDAFEDLLYAAKIREGVVTDLELSVPALKQLVADFQQLVRQLSGQTFPADPRDQLVNAVRAVFESWYSARAISYRQHFGINEDLGTAVNVQAMVFGNLGSTSGTGVVFTRNPSTGDDNLFGEYLPNAQGEDVVAGNRNPFPIETMERIHPEVFNALYRLALKLEIHFKQMQDVEFTFENGKLWLLQTRDGKCTAAAAVKIAVDLADSHIIDHREAVRRIQPEQLEQLLHPRFDESARQQAKLLATGLNASPGAAVGMIVFDADTAQAWDSEGKGVVLVRPETNPDDIHGMVKAEGILTKHGGATSHAAVVTRGLGIPCIVGCEALQLDLVAKTMTVNGQTFKEGDFISLDGGLGEVYEGQLPTIALLSDHQPDVTTLLSWANEIRTLEVWANADTPHDAATARRFGAEGIGLCRVEHAILAQELLRLFRDFVLAQSAEDQQIALESLKPLLRDHFAGIFREMNGWPVVIRLLDPPVHEFFPKSAELLVEVTTLRLGRQKVPAKLAELEKTLSAITQMEEANPMLGLRGVRLGLRLPAITKLQVSAILEAAFLAHQDGILVNPKVMIPLVSHLTEIHETIRLINEAEAEFAQKFAAADWLETLDLEIGVMMETPRAALIGAQTAPLVRFASVGSNDLTQMTWGLSRDDAEGKFLLWYLEQGYLTHNPFQTLD